MPWAGALSSHDLQHTHDAGDEGADAAGDGDAHGPADIHPFLLVLGGEHDEPDHHAEH